MAEKKLSFVPVEKMTSVYEKDEILDLPQIAYEHFMKDEGEVLYILHERKMAGVCSIGDLERFYREGKDDLKINRKYTVLKNVDYSEAAVFFEQVKSVNEVPVITADNVLTGVIKYEKEEVVKAAQRRALKNVRKNLWYKKEIGRFLCKTKAKVFLYTYSYREIVEHLNKEEQQILRRRREKAGTADWCGLSEEEWRVFWREKYEEGIVNTMKTEMETSVPVMEKGVMSFPDREGKCYRFENGLRVTPNSPSDAKKRIILYGPCIILGGYCKDDQTIAYYLQKYLNRDYEEQWKVINKGLFGPDYCYAPLFTDELSENDIVIIGCADPSWVADEYRCHLAFKGNLAEIFAIIEPLTEYIANTPLHCNYIVNQKIADRIYQDLNQWGILKETVKDTLPEKLQDYYINWDVCEYFADYFRRYELCREKENLVKGAIVMNCNPFTKGHRYLIEQALGSVDKLYVFVVEEDKSSFTFRDRFEMVRQGVADLSEVVVIPSGKYILSIDTFAQYFEKETVQVVDNMDYDIRIFGEVVARELGIQYRFVGEEPFDRVTKSYNETMKRILPEYGVSVIEIPRVTCDEENKSVISATRVRKALEEKNWKIVETFCPGSTVSYLKNMFDEVK